MEIINDLNNDVENYLYRVYNYERVDTDKYPGLFEYKTNTIRLTDYNLVTDLIKKERLIESGDISQRIEAELKKYRIRFLSNFVLDGDNSVNLILKPKNKFAKFYSVNKDLQYAKNTYQTLLGYEDYDYKTKANNTLLDILNDIKNIIQLANTFIETNQLLLNLEYKKKYETEIDNVRKIKNQLELQVIEINIELDVI